jgi:hypothetical protein
LQLSHLESALEDLQLAHSLCPTDRGIATKLQQAKRLHDLKRKREREVYTRLFQQGQRDDED